MTGVRVTRVQGDELLRIMMRVDLLARQMSEGSRNNDMLGGIVSGGLGLSFILI